MFKRMFSLTKPVKDVLSVVFYIVFFVYVIVLIVQAPDLSSKILYFILLVGIGAVAAWFEGLKAVLNSAIKQTILYCDREKAEPRLRILEKTARFHPYGGSVCILRLMLLLDHGLYREAAEMAEANASTVLAENAELKLVARHTRFIAYGELGDIARSAEFYHDVCNLKFIRVNNKVKSMAPYYSWDEIDAAYYYYTGKYNKGLRSMKNVSTHSMNPREKVNHYHLYARLYHKDGQLKKALEQMDLAIQYTARNLDRMALLETEKQEWVASDG